MNETKAVSGHTAGHAAKTGQLSSIGLRQLGARDKYFWVECVDCQTQYPDSMCNGRAITKCPWCRPDTAAWTNGRGL